MEHPDQKNVNEQRRKQTERVVDKQKFADVKKPIEKPVEEKKE